MGLDNPLHIAFVVVILLLLFGAKRLPEIGRSLGSGMREFKEAVTGEAGAKGAARQALPQAPQQPETTAPEPAIAAASAPTAAPAPPESTRQA
ncbi:MAG TPA: twin-arginine translocase TatA/TatE family subunit [Solirubrobacteraceae bacterium]|nr:twin-arginine translocase TatA/TatE family subunit [Solirubrobacteraceae bacterium]